MRGEPRRPVPGPRAAAARCALDVTRHSPELHVKTMPRHRLGGAGEGAFRWQRLFVLSPVTVYTGYSGSIGLLIDSGKRSG